MGKGVMVGSTPMTEDDYLGFKKEAEEAGLTGKELTDYIIKKHHLKQKEEKNKPSS